MSPVASTIVEHNTIVYTHTTSQGCVVTVSESAVALSTYVGMAQLVSFAMWFVLDWSHNCIQRHKQHALVCTSANVKILFVTGR